MKLNMIFLINQPIKLSNIYLTKVFLNNKKPLDNLIKINL